VPSLIDSFTEKSEEPPKEKVESEEEEQSEVKE